MKKYLFSIMMVVGCLVFQTGCVSNWNHNRVVDSQYRNAILATQAQPQMNLMSAGVSPQDAVRLSIMANPDNEVTAKIMFNVADYNGIKGYFRSYASAPVSSSASLITDLGLGYGLYKLGEAGVNSVVNNRSGKNNNDTTVNVHVDGSGNRTTVVAGKENDTRTSQGKGDGSN